MADDDCCVIKCPLGNESRNDGSCLEVLVAVLGYLHGFAGVRTAVEEALAHAFRRARFSIALLIRLSSNTIVPAWMLLRHVERSDVKHSQFAGSMENPFRDILRSHCIVFVACHTLVLRSSSGDAHLTCGQHGRPTSAVCEYWSCQPWQELLCPAPCPAIYSSAVS